MLWREEKWLDGKLSNCIELIGISQSSYLSFFCWLFLLGSLYFQCTFTCYQTEIQVISLMIWCIIRTPMNSKRNNRKLMKNCIPYSIKLFCLERTRRFFSTQIYPKNYSGKARLKLIDNSTSIILLQMNFYL